MMPQATLTSESGHIRAADYTITFLKHFITVASGDPLNLAQNILTTKTFDLQCHNQFGLIIMTLGLVQRYGCKT